MRKFASLAELAAYLKSEAGQDGYIQLDESILSDQALAVVEQYLGCKGFALAVNPAAIPDAPGDTLSFPATTPADVKRSFLNLAGKPVQPITFRLAGAGHELQFAMQVALGDWSFGTSFPGLRGLSINRLTPALTAPTFQFTTEPATNTHALTFASPLKLAGSDNPLLEIIDLVPGIGSSLTMQGPIIPTDNGPAPDLQANLLASGFKLGDLLQLNPPFVGVRVSYIPLLADSTAASLQAAKLVPAANNYVGSGVTVKSGDAELLLRFEATIYPKGSYTALLVQPDPSKPWQGSIGNLISLVGNAAVGEFDALFSSDAARKFKNDFLGRIGFKSLSANFAYKTGKITYMAVSVGSVEPGTGKPKQWSLFDGALTFDFDLRWIIINPASANPVMSASLTANVAVGGLPFELGVEIPALLITGRYAGGPLTLRLGKAVKQLTGVDLPIPDDLADLTLTAVGFTADPTQGRYSFNLGGAANFNIFGIQLLSITDGTITVDQYYTEVTDRAGVTAKKTVRVLTLNGVIGILGIDFAVSAVISQDPKTDTIFEVHMVDQTVGSLLQYLVNLVDPYFKLSMDAPWDALLNLKLDALVLKVNVSKGTVSLVYNTDIKLGFIDISGLGLLYQKAMVDPKTGARTPSSVQIALECTFLGKQYGGAGGDPLGWDPMNDPAPAVPGKSPILELNYVGLGQHVVPDTGDLETMAGIIEAMQKAMVPADGGTANPAMLPGISFRVDSHWLIAARFTIMGAVELIPIFNDPDLYGIRIALSGPKVGTFAGLDFEILYKKVTPTVGLYHIALTLPAAMRSFEFGVVSVTLPSVVLDIYTNGNFLIDVGFPQGMDFSRSFAVQAYFFTGQGGFYFGVLSGETTKKVPKISNGTFDPVIVFGLGLSLGVGRSIDKGIFKAGLSVSVIGILEGVLAWFNPDTDTIPAEMYFWVQGTVGIVGRLFGKVDFAIISVDVQAVVYAAVSLTVAAYEPMYIMLVAGVSVSASIKILFIRISFRFSTQVEARFTVGEKRTTPWRVVEQGGGAGQKLLAAQPTAHPVLQGTALFALRANAAVQPGMDWAPTSVAHLLRRGRRHASLQASLAAARANGGEQPQLTVLLLPAFTQAGGTGPGAVQAVLLPFLQNAVPPGAGLARLHEVVAGAAETPFVQLVSHLLAWTIQARFASIHSQSPVVTAADLRFILQQLGSPETADSGFNYANLTRFISENFRLSLQARPQAAGNTAPVSATIFPILPALTMSAAGMPTIDFGSHNGVDKAWQQQIDAYVQQMLVAFEESAEEAYNQRKQGEGAGNRNAALTTAETAGDPPPPLPSMAKVIFRDYFRMLARDAVQAAIDHLERYPYTIPAGTSPSLNEVAALFSTSETEHTTTAGETLQQLADTYGVLVSVIQQVNPAVAGKAPTDPLPGSLTLVIPIGALTESSAMSGDTLNRLSLRYQIPVAAIRELNEPVRSIDPDLPIPPGTRLLLPVMVTAESILLANRESLQLLKAGAQMPIRGVAYAVRSGDTFAAIADTFVKGSNPFLASLLAANATAPVLQTGTVLTFDPDRDGITYTTHEGDSINLIATLFVGRSRGPALYSGVQDLAATIDAILATNPPAEAPQSRMGPDTPIKPGTQLAFLLPDRSPVSYVTNPLDTARLVAAYFLAMRAGSLDLSAFVPALIQLNQLTVTDRNAALPVGTTLKIPAFSYTVNTGDSLTRISRLFGVGTGRLATVPSLPAIHAPLVIPDFQHPVSDGDTFSNLAQRYNLSFDLLTAGIAGAGGLLADQTPDGKPVVLTVPRVPARHTADLVADLVDAGRFNQTAGMVSRFLMHGLRLPVNGALPGGDTAPLYALIGQQFALPTTAAEGYEIGLTNSGGVPWLSFAMSSYYAAAGATLDALAARFVAKDQGDAFKQAVQQLNPAVKFPLTAATWLSFPAAMPLAACAISLTAPEVAQVAELRGAKFAPDLQRLEPLPLYRETPDRFALQKKLPWQAAVLPAGTCLTSGSTPVAAPTIWPFPASLQQRVDALPDPAKRYPLYELMVGTQEDSGSQSAANPVDCYLWATQVSLKVQRMPNADGNGSLPNTYLLVGTDEAGRERLQNVWAYLTGPEAKQAGTTAGLTLLYSPATVNADAGGVRSDKLSLTGTYILRTNLSTLSQSGPAYRERLALLGAGAEDSPPPPAGVYDAPLTDPSGFVKLLWECSVVYSGGYYLQYLTDQGGGLPDDAFGDGNEATLSLLILVSDPPVPSPHPSNPPTPSTPFIGNMHNCALVGQSIDTSKSHLFVQPIVQIVAAGDTFTSATASLNKAYGLSLSVGDLAIANQSVKGLLKVGAALDVGGTQPYQVIYGDTLASIAAAYKLDAAGLVLKGANATTPILVPGMLLQIHGGQLHAVATVPPGNTGFLAERPDPDATDNGAGSLEMEQGQYLNTIYQLLTFRLAQQYQYTATVEGLPAGPASSDHDATDGLRRGASPEGTVQPWQYQKVLPIARFANDGIGSDLAAADANAALPAAVADPYRDIALAAADSGKLLVAVDLQFRDVYGNTTVPDKPVGPIAIPTGYYDNLIGLDGWPSLSSAYQVQPRAGGATLQLSFDFKIGQYVPGPETPYANALQKAGAHRVQYQQVLYQLWQPDLLLRLRTTLDQPPSGSTPTDGYAADTALPPRTPYPLTRSQKLQVAGLAGSIHTFLTAARNLDAYQYLIKGGETPTQVADQFGTDVTALLKANADLDVADLFGPAASLAIPTFYIVQVGDSVNSMAKVVPAEALVRYNLAVPLNQGLDIATPDLPVPYQLQKGDTLRRIASLNHAYAAALAETNQLHPLTEGLSLRAVALTLPVAPDDTLQSMVAKFKAQQVETTPGALGLANQDTPDLFDRGTKPALVIADYVLQKGDTLDLVRRPPEFRFNPADLLLLNGDLINLFPAGTRLQNGVAQYTCQHGDTLSSVAAQHGFTVEQLAALNGTVPLVASSAGKLSIPQTVTLDQSALPAAVYRISGGQKLADIAAKFRDPATLQPLTAAGLAGLNRQTPHLFAPGVVIKVGAAQSVTTGETDTFTALYERVRAAGYTGSFDQFAGDVSTSVTLLQDQALLACPPLHTGQGQTLQAVAATFGLDAGSLLEANRSLSGLFRPQCVTFKGAKVPIGPGDTFLSIISRFAKHGVAVSDCDLIREPVFAGILADQVWLLPAPLPTSIAVDITGTPVNPEEIFPVTVELEMARRLDLVHQDFRTEQAVFLAQSFIAPTTTGDRKDEAHALTLYATGFEQTFDMLKVATGKHGGAPAQQIWAVDFRPGKLSFDIAGNDQPDKYGNNPAVAYFAVKPLANALVAESDVPISPYRSGEGLVPTEAEKRTFQAVDMDVWARQFLAAVDLFLAPAYAVPAYNLAAGTNPDDHDGAYHYRRVLQYKDRLVAAIKQGLRPVFEGTGGDRAEAQEALAQRLLISLANAYEIDTIVQLPVSTTSADGDIRTAPRLSGKPVALKPEGGSAATYSLSTAKVPIVGGGQGAHLTFLVDTQKKSAQNDLQLNLRYAINEIEYAIKAVDQIAGYQASSWLTFVLPIGGPAVPVRSEGAGKSLADRALIGQAAIPIPLRAYPAMPSLVEQAGQGSQVDPGLPLPQLLRQIKAWDYGFTYDHQSASQDSTYIKAVFNAMDAGTGRSPDAPDYCATLFAGLAQFVAVYAAVDADLAALPVPGATAGSGGERLLQAVRAFADLTQIVCEGWEARLPKGQAAEALPAIIYEYRAEIDWEQRVLTLYGVYTTECAYIWPDIAALVLNGGTGAFDSVPLTDKQIHADYATCKIPTAVDSVYATYKIPTAVDSVPWRYHYTFTALDVTAHQSGWASVRIKRNENLGATQGKQVISDFIYQTPAVAFSNPYTPLIRYQDDIAIRQDGEALQPALDNLFKYLLFDHKGSAASISVKVAWRYGYWLGDGSGLRTFYPLALASRFDFQLTDAWRQGFAVALEQALSEWVRQQQPATAGGAFYLDLSVYTGAAGEGDQPLLDIRNLYYELATQ